MSTAAKPTLAFLGATGGCCLAALSLSLKAEYPCRALVRTPDKLTNLLSARSIPTTSLTIISGSVSSNSALQEALRGADIIFSGVGGAPRFWPNPFRPVLDQPTICGDTAAATIEALAALQREGGPVKNKKPLLVALSTTGITSGAQDVPYLMLPLYKFWLHHPHQDKAVMEKKIVDQMHLPEVQRAIRNFVIVRPTLLMDGEAVGVKDVREGVEKEVAEGSYEGTPAVGYTIRREDVGAWLFEKIVDGDNENYAGGYVTLTY